MRRHEPNTTWRKELEEAREGDLTPIIAYAPNEAAFDVPFYNGYGVSEGPPVLAWSEGYVYFPAVYDGQEWMGRAPRNPRPDGQDHIGGE